MPVAPSKPFLVKGIKTGPSKPCLLVSFSKRPDAKPAFRNFLGNQPVKGLTIPVPKPAVAASALVIAPLKPSMPLTRKLSSMPLATICRARKR